LNGDFVVEQFQHIENKNKKSPVKQLRGQENLVGKDPHTHGKRTHLWTALSFGGRFSS